MFLNVFSTTHQERYVWSESTAIHNHVGYSYTIPSFKNAFCAYMGIVRKDTSYTPGESHGIVHVRVYYIITNAVSCNVVGKIT